jgi:hypothetical protein
MAALSALPRPSTLSVDLNASTGISAHVFHLVVELDQRFLLNLCAAKLRCQNYSHKYAILQYPPPR